VSIEFVARPAGNHRSKSSGVAKHQLGGVADGPPNMNMILLSSKRITEQYLPAHSEPNDQPAPTSSTNGNLLSLA
jgi:hypothetical protein